MTRQRSSGSHEGSPGFALRGRELLTARHFARTKTDKKGQLLRIYDVVNDLLSKARSKSIIEIVLCIISELAKFAIALCNGHLLDLALRFTGNFSN